jgi:type I restriction enzyme S subunit
MSEWKEYALNSVVDKFIDYRGKTPKKAESGIPLITAKIVKNGRLLDPNEFIAESDYKSWMSRGYPELNDVIVTTEAPLGEVALIKDRRVALGQRLITLQTNKSLCDSIFLKYYFQSSQGQAGLQARASGSTVEGIKAELFKKMEIYLPPPPEQRAIASVLSCLDDKIDLLNRQNKTLESMAETLFRQWFQEGADEGETVTLGEFASNIRENAKIEDLPNYRNYVGLEHIPRKNIALLSWGNTDSIESNKSVFLKGDILFGKLRSYFHKVVFAPIDGVCSTDILVIRPKKPAFFAFCLFWFFSKEVVGHSDLASGGTRMPRTNWEIISKYQIPSPDLSLLDEFSKLSQPMLSKIAENVHNIHVLVKLRDTLLPKLMSGEAKVEV